MNPDGIPYGWLALGFLGQAAFSGRFLVQWIASERRRQSFVPVAFWWFSMVGGVLLLAYAIHRLDPVFALGQAGGLVVYTRNLVLIRRDRRQTVVPGGAPSRSAPPPTPPPRR